MTSQLADCALDLAPPLRYLKTMACPPTSHFRLNMAPLTAKMHSEAFACPMGPHSSTGGTLSASPSSCASLSQVSCASLHADAPRSPTPESAQPSANLTLSQPAPSSSHLGGLPNTSNTNELMYQTELWRRAQSFIAVLTTSPIVASAVASLQVHGFPIVGNALPSSPPCDLKWTLSGMLAYFLRSGIVAATEEHLIAILWLMESWSDAHRSYATQVLGDYLKHLAAFDVDRARSMSATWRESFCTMRADVVDAQTEILNGMQWDVSFNDETIQFSQQMLFGSPTAPSNDARAIYIPQVISMCQRITEQAARIVYSNARKKAQEAAAAAACSSNSAKRAATPMFSVTRQNMPPAKQSMGPPQAKRPRQTVMQRITPALA